MRTAAILMLLLLPTSADSRVAQIEVEYDPVAFVSTIRVRAEDGRVAWADVLRGLAKARGHDDSALEGNLPDGRLNVTGAKWLLARGGLNLALQPHVRFDVRRDEDGQPWLEIQMDRAALMASKRRFQRLLREAFTRRQAGKTATTYGLVLDENWQDKPAKLPLVVLIHGLNSRPEEIEGFVWEVRDAGFGCATVRYPNDQPIVDSAELLADELSVIVRDYPGRSVSLVTHSMGGLVARAAIEDPGLDPGNVRQLIMISPPNHGSSLANFAFGLDFWEHAISEARKRRTAGPFSAAIEDGLAEAARDLRPESPFLGQLNARCRNADVAYTIILGTKAPLAREDLDFLQKQLAVAGGKSRWVRFFGARLETQLGDLDEVVDGSGDGVVSVQRGRLEGVEDVVLLEFGHMGIFDSTDRDVTRAVCEEILKRLRTVQ